MLYLFISICIVAFSGWFFWGRDSKEFKEYEMMNDPSRKKELRKKKLKKIEKNGNRRFINVG